MADAILLIGHGGVPKDMPRSMLTELRSWQLAARGDGTEAAEATRRAGECEQAIRNWPRNDDNDPYRLGVEALAEALREHMPGVRVKVAYNEYCAPAVDEALDALAEAGAREVDVLTTMMASGGSHGGVDIPEALAAAAERHPDLRIAYRWPVPPQRLAAMFAALIEGR
ncbi:MAG: CbiX/SirB N-terminal domain-containing protein [Polyangiaceae bacterium]